jgi:hypothetical protein
LRLKNYGKTPATNVIFGEIYMKTGIDGQWVASVADGSEKIPHPIAPDEEVRIDGITPQGISPTQWSELKATSKGISIKGTLSYKDAANQPHETGFCLTRLNLGGITFCKDNYTR